MSMAKIVSLIRSSSFSYHAMIRSYFGIRSKICPKPVGQASVPYFSISPGHVSFETATKIEAIDLYDLRPWLKNLTVDQI